MGLYEDLILLGRHVSPQGPCFVLKTVRVAVAVAVSGRKT